MVCSVRMVHRCWWAEKRLSGVGRPKRMHCGDREVCEGGHLEEEEGGS